MPKNYYLVLGIDRRADLGKIKRAYRRCVKRYHPDTAPSPNDGKRFRELTEAYETLCDREKRRLYDAELGGRSVRVNNARPISPSAASAPLRPGNARPPLSDFFSSTDDLLEGFLPGFFDPHDRPFAPKDMYLEVVLSPREALQGGLFPVTVPVFETCPHCGGGADRWFFICPACGDAGRIRSQRSFTLSIPPRTADGTRVTIPLADIGLRGTDIHVYVRIDPDMA
jgi:molecular chaperone DnaJ